MTKIPIKTTKEKFYRQLLELLRSIPPFNKLRTKELDVLSELLYQNNKYKQIPSKERFLIIFSTDNRKEMRDRLGMNIDIYNNNLSGLRKHGIINSDNKPIKFLENLFFDNNYVLEFNFKI